MSLSQKLSCLIPGCSPAVLHCQRNSVLYRERPVSRAAGSGGLRASGRAQRGPDGLQSALVWGCGSQEAIIAAISFNNGAYQFLGSAKGVSSSRPRFCEAPRAAVVKAGRHCGGASGCVVSRPRLDDGEPGAKLDGRDDRSCSTTNVILDWAVDNACGNTASPCIRSGTKTRYPNPSCTVKAKPSKDGTHLRSG